MPELLGAQGGVCRNCWGLRGGYAGGSGRGVCRTFGGSGGWRDAAARGDCTRRYCCPAWILQELLQAETAAGRLHTDRLQESETRA